MGTLSYEPPADVKPSHERRAEMSDGSVLLTVQVRRSRSFNATTWLALLCMPAGLVAGALLVDSLQSRATVARIPLIVGEIGCVLIGLAAMFHVLAFIAISAARTSVTIGPNEIEFFATGRIFRIPLEHIRALDARTLKTRALDLDTEADSILRVWRRVPSSSLEVQTDAGTLRFFGWLRRRQLEWLAEEIHSCAQLSRTASSAPASPVASASMSYGTGRRVLLSIGIGAAVIGTSIFTVRLAIGSRSNSWPGTKGVIESTQWEDELRDNGDAVSSYIAKLVYRYTVGGREFHGSTIGYDVSGQDAVAHGLLDRRAAGASITVYYDPANPSRAVLVRGIAPFEYVPLVAGILCFVITTPLLLSRASAAQVSLLERYQHGFHETASTTPPEEVDTIAWSQSADDHAADVRLARRAIVLMAVRTTLICAGVIVLAWHWSARLMPDVPWQWILSIGPGAAGGLFALMLLETLFPGAPPIYRIKREGVALPSSKRPFVRWDRIDSFTLDGPTTTKSGKAFVIHEKSGRWRRLPWPEDSATATQILDALSAQLPQREPLSRYAPLRSSDWMVGFVLTTVFCLTASQFVREHLKAHKDPAFMGMMMLITFIAGPGTIWALCLIRKRCGALLFWMALLLNICAAMGTGGIAAIQNSLESIR